MMFLMVLCSFGLMFLYIVSIFVFMMFMFSLVWMVWYRNIVCIVLCMWLLFWKLNEMLEILFDIFVVGRFFLI